DYYCCSYRSGSTMIF
nr:immunoglobulin light chain junction region [Macaca mulatta]MOW03557.1 immunoglobulin light chain junction region [Macaca mulatta]MOW03722.1 immunoglobulin light chain junction region [Macaca mulatta]